MIIMMVTMITFFIFIFYCWLNYNIHDKVFYLTSPSIFRRSFKTYSLDGNVMVCGFPQPLKWLIIHHTVILTDS